MVGLGVGKLGVGGYLLKILNFVLNKIKFKSSF